MRKFTTAAKEYRKIAMPERHHSLPGILFLSKISFLLISVMMTMLVAKAQQSDEKYFNNVNTKGLIIDGFDAVAFFTDNKPVKGDEKFQFRYQDAVYHFVSQEHLELFKANPEKYKPQFGGWCAYAVSLGRIAPIDVNNFLLLMAGYLSSITSVR